MLVAIGVHDGVVGNAQEPRRESSRGDILTLVQLHDHLDERLLEDVISPVMVANDEHDIGKKLLLVAL